MKGLLLLVSVDIILLPTTYLAVRKGWDRFEYSGATIEIDLDGSVLTLRSP